VRFAGLPVLREVFGTLPDGRVVHRYTLGTPGGIRVSVLDLGAVVQAVHVPSRGGRTTGVVLGAPDLSGYLRKHDDYYGAVVGRFANRIAGGRFSLDGIDYQLLTNDGPNTLHSGPDGFHRRLWTVRYVDSRRIELSLNSPYGDQGFPGELAVTVTYDVREDAVHIRYQATTTAPTVINLTNHAHFNLDGEGAGSIEDHTLQVAADSYLPIGADLIPVGHIAPVEGTPLDFRQPRRLADAIHADHHQVSLAGGIDHTFVLASDRQRPAVVLESSDRRRQLAVFTDQPGVQVYSGNAFDGTHVGPAGQRYERHAGIALETQTFPNAPNMHRPDWPNASLRPGERYDTTTIWRFKSLD
jgi:aldose 1-epimerase